MLSQFTKQYYILDPSRQQEDQVRDFSAVIWVQMETKNQDECKLILSVYHDSAPAKSVLADEIARIFSEFGDLNVYKDSHSSFFIEFYFIEPSAVPTQTIPDFIKVLFAKEAGTFLKNRGIKDVVPY